MAVSYECRATLPAFTIAYPPDWRLTTEQAVPNQGRIVLDTEGAQVIVGWGPATTLQNLLTEALEGAVRHEVGPAQRATVNWISWQEIPVQVWKEARAAQPDKLAIRLTQRNGASWHVIYRLAAAQAIRRKPALDAILRSLSFLSGQAVPEPSWRHHRYMANAVEFAFNHPSRYDVLPEVQGEEGTCMVQLPDEGRFFIKWGPQLDAVRYLEQGRMQYREFAMLLERPDLRLRNGTWNEVVFDGLRMPISGWGDGRPAYERGRYRHGENGGLTWLMGYSLPHSVLGAVQPLADRMLASMRILGLQDALPEETAEARGVQLELGAELALCFAPRATHEPVAIAERLVQEIPLLRVLLAYEGHLLPHLPVKEHPGAPLFGWRIRLGSQCLVERDVLKGDFEPLGQILEDLRLEAPKLDGMLTPRLSRPELVQQLFPRAPNAYEKLRGLRPELQLPPYQ